MDPELRSALIAGEGRTLHPSIESLLHRSTISVEHAPTIDAAVKRFEHTSFDLVILHLPMPDLDLTAFVQALRAPGSASRKAGLLVIGETEDHETVSMLLGRGVNRFLTPEAGGGEWLDALATLLAVPPRSSLRALVQLEAAIRGSRSRALTQTENISETGMLVRGGWGHYRPGTVIEFELILPGEELPIRGQAEIVRRTERNREGIDGIGVRFLKLEGDGLATLKAFLSRKTAF